MSLNANISIILHLHHFKNIALPHKARYALRCIIYQGKQMKNCAMPFNLVETQTKSRKNVSRQSEFEDNYFLSKKFNIEYQQEEIQLNDCCEFKFSIEAFPEFKDNNIYLEFILMENGNCYYRQNMDAVIEMKEVDKYRFKLEDLRTGVFRYCEGEFNQNYISSFSFTLFAMITDYRFHPYKRAIKSQATKEKAREKVSNWLELMHWGQNYLKDCEDGRKYIYRNFVKSLRYNSSCLRAQAINYFKGHGQNIIKAPLGEGGQLIPVSDKEFFDYMTSYYPADLINEELIIKEIHETNVQNFEFIEEIKRRISKGGIEAKALKDRYRMERRDLFSERVFRSIVYGKQPRDKETNIKIAKKMRKKSKINQTKIVDEYLFTLKKNQHYVFLEVNLPKELKIIMSESSATEEVLKELSDMRQDQMKKQIHYDQRNMLVVMVHGFQASSFDMQIIKRQVFKMLPVAMFLISSCNEMDTDGDISIMGFRLAEEIKSYIGRNVDDEEVIINFIGHSMGGIIARAALVHLGKYKNQLGFFFSLSSPHLGYLNGVDTMIKTGLWFMRKMNKVKSLDQLSLEDNSKKEDTLLYKLSKEGHLRHFKKVILLSSSEDSYVAWHSARIQYYESSNTISKMERDMIDSILSDQIVHRIDVHFDIDSTEDVNSFIGRTAHINLLTHQSLFKLINEAIPTLFDIRMV